MSAGEGALAAVIQLCGPVGSFAECGTPFVNRSASGFPWPKMSEPPRNQVRLDPVSTTSYSLRFVAGGRYWIASRSRQAGSLDWAPRAAGGRAAAAALITVAALSVRAVAAAVAAATIRR